MADCVTVAVAARLHLGFLDLNGELGRRFGGLGLAVDEPETVLELSRSRADSAAGPQADRARRYLDSLVGRLGLPAGHRLVIRRAIPAHAGLGSGTQLALAVAAALRRLHALAPDVEADALFLDRGARSGLGTSFFGEGGIALDGGRGDADRPAPIISRLPFPEEWHVLLVLDPARQGIHGMDEVAAFKALPPFPAELAAHLCRLAVMQALPAVVEHDIKSFGHAVAEMQAHIGDHFRPVQGGRFASPDVAATLELLAANGAEGCGQSSWGPTGFGFAASAAEARKLRDAAAPLAAEKGLEIMGVKARNGGARIGETAQVVQRGALHG
ncbi:MAG: beta-ribofuranosylaminobenzene 5'-phosphate synthase family protein [Propylenella sp.]